VTERRTTNELGSVIGLSRASSVLDITHVQAGQRVRLRGRLDVHTVADVRAELRVAVVHGTGELLVDLTGVELGDTTGLGVLLGVHRRAVRAGRAMVLVGVSPGLQRLLVATRLARVLHVRAEESVSA
jgi:anti-sigma B factor antagonist